MKAIILILSIFLFSLIFYIYTWEIPAPKKEVKKEINILDFKK